MMRKPLFNLTALIILSFLLLGNAGRTLSAQADQQESSLPASSGEIQVTVDLSRPESVSVMRTGATHTEYSLDAWGDAEAIERGRALLQTAADFQNQHIMGWGATNPEPAPGVYNFAALDARIQTMRSSGATIVLTLCCAPGWMRPNGYQEDWKHLEVAPDPAHLQDFVDLVVTIVQRYPDVEYFQVWNELKGMWGTSPGCTPSACGKQRWDYERYTTLYNAVYDAVKAVRPNARIGGPYVVMSTYSTPKNYTGTISGPYGYMDQRALDVITYWLANKHGADFITIDAGTRNKDGIWITDEYSQAQKFADVNNWIRRQPNGGASLPIHWAEWNASIQNEDGNLARYNTVIANALIYAIKSGTTLPLIWQIQGNAKGLGHPAALFSDTRMAGGGQATPLHATLRAFREHFPPGTQLVYTAVSSPADLIALGSAAKTILVNKSATELNVRVNEMPLTLAAYEVRVIDTPLLVAATP
jgi:hypothetical protein